MKKIFILLFVLSTFIVNAQLITTTPTFPTAGAAVTVIFNADQGNKGLMGYTGDVYAHTGVITSKSTSGSDWKYVKTNWAVNTPETKLTRLSANQYKLEITPTILAYYGVPTSEKILKLAFVFRNSDGSKTGKTAEGGDIYAEVYEESISVSLIQPEQDIIVTPNQQISISAASNMADSLILYIDNTRIQATTSNTLSATVNALSSGKHWIWVEAKDASESVYDSVYYFVRNNATIAELPQGAVKGINYIDDNTVTLVLYAPQKEYVYLIGDFNNWDVSNVLETKFDTPKGNQLTATTWQMNKTSDGTHFWMTLEDVNPGVEYRFQYWIDGQIKIADPYADKILDPWNDKYITSTTYPNLIAYPSEETTEIVSVFQTAQQPYAWQVTDFTPPAITDMVIYELLIRDFVATHSYKTIADTLDYLQKLGVNVLELMPINEFEGNSSWGYNPSFYFAPDKYYGTKNDLKHLVDECHKRGMAVVIDMVLNHSFGQSPLVRMYFSNGNPSPTNPWYNVTSPNQTYQWGYDFNHERAVVKAFVDSVNSYWMSEYKVDGFRFDFTKGFTQTTGDGWAYDASRIAILKRMATEIWKRNPDAYVIFEHLADNTEEKALADYGILLWGNMNFSYNEGTMGYNEGGKSDFSWISYQKRNWNNPHVVGYMESHDEERLMYKNKAYGNASGDYNIKDHYTALRRIELAANFFLTIPGPKMIWQFGELGYDYSIDYNGRVGEKPIKWDYYNQGSRKRIYEIMGYLNALKTSEPAFRTDNYELSVGSAVKTIHLNHSSMNVLVVGNFDVVTRTVIPDFQQTGLWYEYYTGAVMDVTDTQIELSLAPGEYRLYTTKQFSVPDINVSVLDGGKLMEQGKLNVYPNPANDELFIAEQLDVKQVVIYDLLGNKIFVYDMQENTPQIKVGALKPGVFIVSATMSDGTSKNTRFVKN